MVLRATTFTLVLPVLVAVGFTVVVEVEVLRVVGVVGAVETEHKQKKTCKIIK